MVKSNKMPPRKSREVGSSSKITSNIASSISSISSQVPSSVPSSISSSSVARKLMPHQVFVRDFLGADKPHRGLLLYHGLGSGKTCASIAIASSLIMDDRAPQQKVIVMLPANLRTNFDAELQPCGSGLVVHYIHYNGVSDAAAVRILKDTSFFDNAVIIIDEAHNFASAAANGGVLARFYKRIVDAQDSRVVLLSGTPLMNSSHEVAFLVNMTRGVQKAYTIPLQQKLSDTDMQALSKCPYVQNAVSTTIGRALQSAVTIHLVPDHFKYAGGARKSLVLDSGGSVYRNWMDNATDAVLRIIGDKAGGRRRFPAPERILPLPDNKDTFETRFMDTENGQIKQDTLAQLESAMSGCISYFEGHDQTLYPQLRKFVIVRVHMSRHQFAEYSYQRAIEIRREQAARVRARISRTSASSGEGGDGGGMVYRPFSRAVCNFAFPHDVPRPYKKDGGDKYEKQLSDTIETLTSKYPERLRLEVKGKGGDDTASASYTLETLSPKFANVLRYLTAHPHRMSIVYSQFRTVEGVGIFASVLKANGFGILECRKDEKTNELRVHSDIKGAGVRRYLVWGANGKEGDKLLLSIYNNRLDNLSATVKKDLKALIGGSKLTNLHGEIVCVLFVSKAGAEGINTSNVREVHILEPFWHANRIEQVVGRARRAHSHDGLSSNERNVDVYVHMSTFTAQQAKLHKDKDQGKSSDEHVHDIAQKKHGILREIQGIMKRVSATLR